MDNNIGTIIKGLDAVQLKAVQTTDGPVLIVAGAGAGKTRVLTSRIAYVLEKGCDPGRIMALTFTKKAATEMKDRIGLMVGEKKARRLFMGTFHSVFIRFLREYADYLGYPSAFTIYDTSDSISAVKRCLKTMNLDDKVYKPKTVLSVISAAKNDLWTVPAYRKNLEFSKRDSQRKMPRMADVYEAYQTLLKQSGVMDFDDILMNMNILLKHNPEALADISGRFDYLLVDEYQDTNFSQYLILKALSSKHRNICVVGDDSQSIYAFRGARIQNILNFSKDYPDYQLFKLERNYRSTQIIVNAANSVIAKNEGRIPKVCFSADVEGKKIRLISAYTDKEEALLVVSSIISKMASEHGQYQDFAILYRTNSQSKALEEALRKRNIPYRIFSGNSFFDRQEVKDMMAYFKLAVNINDDESFRRIVNTPARGIGDTSVEALAAAAKAHQMPLLKAIDLPDLEQFGLRAAAIKKLKEFQSMISKAYTSMTTVDAYDVAMTLSNECGLYRSLKEDNSVESQSRAANVEELLNSVKDFVDKRHNDYVEEMMSDGLVSDNEEIAESDLPVVTLGEFLEDISLLSAVDTADGDEEDTDNKVALMTVHSSKGLEFPHVYVVGMEDGLFPSYNDSFSVTPAELEEERRLFYVAVTRAEKTVELSFCQSRMKNGKTVEFPPSRFLRDIAEQYLENPLKKKGEEDFMPRTSSFGQTRMGAFPQRQGGNNYGRSGAVQRSPASAAQRQDHGTSRPSSVPGSSSSRPVLPKPQVAPKAEDPNFIPVSALSLREGMRIEHSRFGFGDILEISGSPADLKAKIRFDEFGEKILILRYAKIRLA